jgi:hypothetical protein
MEYVDDYVHGLSQVEFHRGSAKNLPAWSNATEVERDHISSLEGLALLLVFSAKGDVAAVTYWRSADELRVLWANYELVKDSAKLDYVNRLLESGIKGAKANEVLSLVISMCKDKILHRVKKLARSFNISQNNPRDEESNIWGFDEKKHVGLHNSLKKAGQLFNDSTSLIDILDEFTCQLGKMTKGSEMADFMNILSLSYILTAHGALDILLEESQVRYLRKLGDYMRAVRRIPNLLRKVGKIKIAIEQVIP